MSWDERATLQSTGHWTRGRAANRCKERGTTAEAPPTPRAPPKESLGKQPLFVLLPTSPISLSSYLRSSLPPNAASPSRPRLHTDRGPPAGPSVRATASPWGGGAGGSEGRSEGGKKGRKKGGVRERVRRVYKTAKFLKCNYSQVNTFPLSLLPASLRLSLSPFLPHTWMRTQTSSTTFPPSPSPQVAAAC